ncbi:MAG: hypothetical protein PHH70_02275 [Candidatus Gracilibacteria bacterium]|nr:hypothetical protein [Candidatus Gracilibacteria bacterium]
MKKLNILLSVCMVMTLCFWALSGISDANQYTSVRKYTKPKATSETIPEKSVETTVAPAPETLVSQKETDTTPPVIEFTNYKDGDVVTDSLINVLVKVTDDQSASDKIVVSGAGRQRMKTGFNSVVVTATDEAGNVGSAYIVIEKQ